MVVFEGFLKILSLNCILCISICNCKRYYLAKNLKIYISKIANWLNTTKQDGQIDKLKSISESVSKSIAIIRVGSIPNSSGSYLHTSPQSKDKTTSCVGHKERKGGKEKLKFYMEYATHGWKLKELFHIKLPIIISVAMQLKA